MRAAAFYERRLRGGLEGSRLKLQVVGGRAIPEIAVDRTRRRLLKARSPRASWGLPGRSGVLSGEVAWHMLWCDGVAAWPPVHIDDHLRQSPLRAYCDERPPFEAMQALRDDVAKEAGDSQTPMQKALGRLPPARVRRS